MAWKAEKPCKYPGCINTTPGRYCALHAAQAQREYSTQRAMHGAIEPDGALVIPENKGLTVYCPCKAPFATRKAVAKACGLRECEVRLIQPAIGGAFGGKHVDINLIASRLAVAALHTGRPCRTVWSREEVMEEGSKRHPFTLKYKAGVTKDGKIRAMDIIGYADAGAYASSSRSVIWRAAVEAAGADAPAAAEPEAAAPAEDGPVSTPPPAAKTGDGSIIIFSIFIMAAAGTVIFKKQKAN